MHADESMTVTRRYHTTGSRIVAVGSHLEGMQQTCEPPGFVTAKPACHDAIFALAGAPAQRQSLRNERQDLQTMRSPRACCSFLRLWPDRCARKPIIELESLQERSEAGRVG